MTKDSLPGLEEALDAGTDRIEAPGFRSRVLAEARRRRNRRNALVAGGTAAAVAAVLVGVTQFTGSSDRTQPAPAGPSETTSESPSAMPTVPAPPIPPQAVHDHWDPITVVDEPFRDSVLPRELSPDQGAPDVADQPMTAAVVAWPQEGQDLRLLDVDGTWRTVSGTAEAVRGTLDPVVSPAISADGRQVAMATLDGLLVIDVSTGERHTLVWPSAFAPPWDLAPALEWMPGGEELLVDFWGARWILGVDGSSRRAPYDGLTAVDPDGSVVERRWNKRELRVWQGDEIESAVGFPFWGERMAAGEGRLALTGGGSGLPGDGGPMVVDAKSGEVVAYAPIRDPNSVYSDNGALTAMGFLDRETVLLLVGPMDFRTMEPGEESWHLVAWDLDNGGFERLSSGDSEMSRIVVAPGVIP